MTSADPERAARQSRGQSTDMSPEAVLRRLRIVEELNAACRLLAQARPLATAAGTERAADRGPAPGDPD